MAVELLLSRRQVEYCMLGNGNGQVDRNAADGVHNLGERPKLHLGIVRDVDLSA